MPIAGVTRDPAYGPRRPPRLLLRLILERLGRMGFVATRPGVSLLVFGRTGSGKAAGVCVPRSSSGTGPSSRSASRTTWSCRPRRLELGRGTGRCCFPEPLRSLSTTIKSALVAGRMSGRRDFGELPDGRRMPIPKIVRDTPDAQQILDAETHDAVRAMLAGSDAPHERTR